MANGSPEGGASLAVPATYLRGEPPPPEEHVALNVPLGNDSLENIHNNRQIEAVNAIHLYQQSQEQEVQGIPAQGQPQPQIHLGPTGDLANAYDSATKETVINNILNQMPRIESGGNPNAVSPKGARGLYQIMPATGAQYGVTDPDQLYNPKIAKQTAGAILSDLYDRYKGNEALVLAAYNAGPGNVDKGIFPQETRDYVNKYNLTGTGTAPSTLAGAGQNIAENLRAGLEQFRNHPIVSTLNTIGAATDPAGYFTGYAGGTAAKAETQKAFPNYPILATLADVGTNILTGHWGDALVGGIDAVARGAGPVSRIVDASGKPFELTSEMRAGAAGVASRRAPDVLSAAGTAAGDTEQPISPLTKPILLGPEQEETKIPRTWNEDYNEAIEQRMNNPYDAKFTQMEPRTALNSTEMAELRLAKGDRQDNLIELGKQYVGTTDPQEQQILMNRALKESSLYKNLMVADKNAGTEAGQALSIRNLSMQFSKKADAIISRATPETMDGVLRAFATLDKVADKTEKADQMDTFFSRWFNGDSAYKALIDARLMNPRVIAQKIITDAIRLPLNIVHQSLATAIRHPLNLPTAGMMFIAGFQGLWKGMAEVSKFAGDIYKTGDPLFTRSIAEGPDPLTYGKETLESLQNDGESVLSDKYPDRVMHYIASHYSAGLRGVMTIDQLAKGGGYRAEENTQALYMGLQQAIKEGRNWTDAYYAAAKYAEMFKAQGLVHDLAYGNMLRDTATDSDAYTNIARAITSAPYVGPLFRIIAPFMHTEVNLWEQGLMNSPMAPVTAKFWGDMTGASGLGSLTRNTTLAKMATGSAFIAWAAHHDATGNLIGDHPADGNYNHARSITADGKTFHSYAHMGDYATTLAMAANYAEFSHQMSTADRNAMAVGLVELAAKTMSTAPGVDKNLQLMRVFDEVSTRGIGPQTDSLISSTLSGYEPYPIQLAAEAISPTKKEPEGKSNVERIWEGIEKNIPGLSSRVPPERDVFGYRQYLPPGTSKHDVPPHWYWSLLNSQNPFTKYKDIKPDDVDKEVMRLEPNFHRVSSSIIPNKKFPNMSIPLTPWQQDRWAVLAGHGIHLPDPETGDMVNQHDAMMNMIHSDDYKDLAKNNDNPDVVKQQQKLALEAVHLRYMNAAKVALLNGNTHLMQKYKGIITQQTPTEDRADLDIGNP